MSRDTLRVFADALMQQIRDAGVAAGDGSFLVSLPAYLDATEVRLLQMEVNRRSAISIELQHRPGERRVGVRLVASQRRR